MNLKEFSHQNRARSREHFPGCAGWTTSDWFVALIGEVGEGANFHKKIMRGDPTNIHDFSDLQAKLQKELADAFAYLDLLAESIGVDLEDIVIQKWNEVSVRVGSPRRLVSGLHVGMRPSVGFRPCGGQLGAGSPQEGVSGTENDYPVR